jgi:hypothetical protein
LGVEVIQLIERTELVSGETCVTVCIAVRRAEIVGKMIQEQRERVSKRTVEGGQNSQREENARYVTEIAISSDSQ